MQASGGGERALAWIAAQQLGVVTCRQLQAAGIGRGAIGARVSKGSLHRVHRGVYLVGHPLALAGALELAAVLACGPSALISHRSAAALWGFARAPEGRVETTVVGRNCRTRAGLNVSRVRRLDPKDRSLRRGIRVTAPARTLVDFASRAASDELERAVAEAYALGLVTERQILLALQRAPNRAGVGSLRAELRREGGPSFTRSEAERRVLQLIRAARLPAAIVNARVAEMEVDFLWAEQRLILEVDGYAYHGGRAAFERDRRKGMELVAAGYRVIRVTWRQIVEQPFQVVATVARAFDASTLGSRATD